MGVLGLDGEDGSVGAGVCRGRRGGDYANKR